jgi:flagella basal body P-ring formation protein FlgA
LKKEWVVLKKLLLLLFVSLLCFGSQKNVGLDLSELNFELVKLYKSEYPSMIIKNITIEPAMNVQLNVPKLQRLELSPNAIKQASGMFSAVFIDSGLEKRIYFRYRILADIEVAKATHDIPRDKKIDISDVEFLFIPFERSYDKSISRDDINGMSAKRFIKTDTIIKNSDFIKTPIVIRNTTVVATLIEGELELDFEALALEDGSMGQIISVKNKNGKVYKGVVSGPSRVSIK